MRTGLVQAVVVALAVSMSAVSMVAGPAQAASGKPKWTKPSPGRSVSGTTAQKAIPPKLAVDAKAVTAGKRAAGKPAEGNVKVAGAGAQMVDRMIFRAGQAGKVDVDYSAVRQAFGADYASRLRLVEIGSGKVMPARNDVRAGKITAEATKGAMYALSSGVAGEVGSFAPTSLAPSATWAVGLQSGDFSWSYPIQVPPAPGPVPQVALAYSSGVVDGRTTSTNNQASWVGEGFGYEPGFIERTYKPCSEDGQPGKGDLCWDRQAAHLVLPGVTGELVWDAVKKVWKVANDEGWRVELRTGATNGDNDGEHWLVTGPDGTQYSFGRETAAKSAWTVPVFGNNAGEPCNGPSFDASWCQQAYRWTLDTVTNTHGDQSAYFYDTETNHYARAGVAGNATSYVRSGHLLRIDYGRRAGIEPNARVLFTAEARCVPGSVCLPSHPADWPDTPWDLDCAGGGCTAVGPSFWGTKRLAKITTQARPGDQYTDVDSWTLSHVFPATEDEIDPVLWLRSIKRTGHVGGVIGLPEVMFDGKPLPNRVGVLDGLSPMDKWRLFRIHNETGGVTEISYSGDPCRPGSLPRQDDNAKKCFPAYWLRAGATAPELDWFNKYVVDQVAEVDRVGQNPAKVTRYEYIDAGPAWRYDANELVPGRFKTWGSWRGFQKVKVRAGAADGPQTLTEHLFLRGMDEDLLLDGTRRDVKIEDSQGKKFEDLPGYAGFARETVVRDSVSGAEISAQFQQPWLSEPTAVRDRESGPLEARILRVDSMQTRTVLAGGGTRMSETRTEYDGYGSVTEAHDLGDVAVPDDDICTTTTYARNAAAWIVNMPNRVVTATVPCGTTAAQADIVADETKYYDGAGSIGTPPVKGNVTRTDKLASWNGTTPVHATVSRASYDQHGRIVESFDAVGAKTTTAYQPATGGPVTGMTVTNPLGHITTTAFDPARGQTRVTVDANGRREERTYDALGRVMAAWQAGRPTTEGPTVRFDYLVRTDGPAAVSTHRLLGDGQYATTHTLYDGLLRERQTQAPGPNGGRIVTDKLYDTHGRVARTNNAYHNADAPSTSLLVVNDNVPAQEVAQYDGAGRKSAEILRSNGQEKHRTTFSYGGDRVNEDPPAGGTPTTRITDIRGRLRELRQYSGDGPSGDFAATKYGYTKDGKQSSVADPAGNVWWFGYDLRGRKVRVEDPDKGVATIAYDDKDRLTAVTDARGITLTHTYDALDRRTGTYEGTRRLTEWTFDSLPGGLGKPVAAIRYADGEAYRTETIGYDALGRPTGTAVTVPGKEGRLAGRYESTVEYNRAGQVTRTSLPAAGGLPAETITTGYNAVGLENTRVSGLASYVAETGYTHTGQTGFRILGDRVLRDYTYDESTRRLTGLSTTLETGDVAVDLAIGYDATGNVVSSKEAVSGDSQCFRNDSFRRLVEAWTATNGCATGPSPAVIGGPAPYWHSYGYDKAGNRTREVRHAPGGDVVRGFGYPAAGGVGPHRLSSVTTGSNVDSYGYDAAGNTITRPGQTLSWTGENRLSKVDENGRVTTVEYDADGERLIRRDPTGSTLYFGETEVRLNTATGAVTGTRYYSAGDATIAVRTESGLSWLLHDHAGTAMGAVDADDLNVTIRRQNPYGDLRGAAPAVWPGERGFVGGTVDGSTGLTHLGARDYDPEIGAFVQVDPLFDATDPQQLHGYAYAGNSPMTYSDPTGLTAQLAYRTRPAVYRHWDGTAAGFRWHIFPDSARLRTVEFPVGEPEIFVRPGISTTAVTSDQLAQMRTGWSPKVPPGYTAPPDTSPPAFPVRPIIHETPKKPAEPGDGSWRVDCETSGLVTTCRYTPIKPGEEDEAEEEYEIGDFNDLYGYLDIEYRDYWPEYDDCSTWNPCDTKKKKKK